MRKINREEHLSGFNEDLLVSLEKVNRQIYILLVIVPYLHATAALISNEDMESAIRVVFICFLSQKARRNSVFSQSAHLFIFSVANENAQKTIEN